MATVTGLTAARMLELADENIVGGEVVGGVLVLTTRGGDDISAGSVVGPTGPTGPAASFAGYTEPLLDLGNVSGAINIDFDASNAFKITPTGAVVITFTNLPAAGDLNPGTLIVANSTYAITYPVATKFPDGEPPILSGETWISMVAQSTHVTLGKAWGGVAV